MKQIVLQRKLTIPSSGELFTRPQLVEKLKLYTQSPLTLIIAPAGYGKTSLVCDWLRYSTHPVYWLSLDEQNNIPSSFWLYLCACLRLIDRDLGMQAEKTLETHYIEDYCLISDLVLASLEKLTRKWNRPSRAIIVLDDFQFINHPQILKSFNRFLDYMPSWLQIVITARKNPALMLANRSSKSAAHIISAPELIFEASQIKDFLAVKLDLKISAKQQSLLFKETEGWAAAIQLIGLALKSGTPIEECSNTSDSLLADFLLEEVFSQQAVPIQNVLKDVCIAKYFDIELCKLFDSNRDNQAILQNLLDLGLFISKVDTDDHDSSTKDQLQSYRLHSLFRHWIINNCSLSHDILLKNKRITLTWLLNNNNFYEALELSIQIKDWKCCAEIMAKLYPSLIQVTHFDHVSSILIRIPDEVIQSLPHLCLLSALISFSRYDYRDVEQYLDHIEIFFNSESSPNYYSDNDRTSLLMGKLILQGQMARFTGQRNKAIDVTHKLESVYYKAGNPLNCWVIFGKAVDYFFNDDIEQSLQNNQLALSLAKNVEDGLCVISALSWLLHAMYHNGQIQQAVTLAEDCMSWLQRKCFLDMPNISSIYAVMTTLYMEQNHLDLAWRSYDKLLDSLHEFTEPREIIYNKFHTQYHLLSSTGRYKEARSCLQQLEHYEDQIDKELGPDFSILLNTKTYSALLESKTGNNLPLLQLIDQCAESHELETTTYRFRGLFEQLVLASAKMIMTSGETDLYDEIAEASALSGNIHRQISCYLIPAQILFALGEKSRAFNKFERALTLASQHQFINLIIADENKVRPLLNLAIEQNIEYDYCITLLTAIEERSNSPQEKNLIVSSNNLPSSTQVLSSNQINQDLIEKLSMRELEVINLINQGNSNKNIAQILSISVSTVKRHLQNTYQKLQVNSRTEAISIMNRRSL
jgi:LuxR family maltose regulon positive regulatory protein